MSWFERETKRWTASPAAPVESGAAEATCPASHWRGKSGRRRSEWSEAGREQSTIRSTVSQTIFGQGRLKISPITTYIILGQETGAEFEVVIQIKGATGLESCPERGHCRCFRQFPHGLDSSELTSVLRGHLWGTTRAAVVCGLHVGTVVLLVVEVGGHDVN